MEQLSIRLKIGNREYPMTINSIELIEDNKKLLDYINKNFKR